MNLVLLAVIFAAIPLFSSQFAGRSDDARVWRAALGLGIVLMVAGTLMTMGDPTGTTPILFAEAQDAVGNTAESTLMADEPNGRRSFWRFVLKVPVQNGYELLLLLGFMGLAGTITTLRLQGVENANESDARSRSREHPLNLVVWGALLAAACFTFIVFSSQPSSQTGQDGVRAALAHFEVGNVSGFTSPDGSWSYVSDHVFILGVIGLLALFGFLQPWLPVLGQGTRDGAAVVAAAGAAFSCVAQIFLVGGLPWRAAEGGIWLAALCLVFAVLHRSSPIQSAALTALALAVTSLAV